MRVIKYIVVEGCGAKIPPALGVFEVLYEQGHLHTVDSLVGTSAGSIISLVVALGYNIDEMKAALSDNFSDYINEPFRNIFNALGNSGLNTGSTLLNKIKSLIAEKMDGNGNATFADLHKKLQTQGESSNPFRYRDLNVVVFNVTDKKLEVRSYHNELFRNEPIAEAVMTSCRLPFFFTPENVYVFNGKEVIKLVYGDGGVERNCFWNFYDYDGVPNPNVLVVKFDSREEIEQYRDKLSPSTAKINGPVDLVKSYVGHFLNLNSQFRDSDVNNFRIIYADTLDVTTTQFSLPESKKNALIHSGRVAAEEYFCKTHPEALKESKVGDNILYEEEYRKTLLKEAQEFYFSATSYNINIEMIFEKPTKDKKEIYEEKIREHSGRLARHYGVKQVRLFESGKEEGKYIISLDMVNDMAVQLNALDAEPQKDEVEQYINHYIYIKNNNVLFYVNNTGEVKPVVLNDLPKFQREAGQLLNHRPFVKLSLVQTNKLITQNGGHTPSLQNNIQLWINNGTLQEDKLREQPWPSEDLIEINHASRARPEHFKDAPILPLDIRRIFEAVRVCNIPRVQELMMENPELKIAENEEGETLLHVAAELQGIKVGRLIGLLADSGVNINALNKQGDTPLHLAVKNQSLDATNALLSASPDTTIKNKKGELAFTGVNIARHEPRSTTQWHAVLQQIRWDEVNTNHEWAWGDNITQLMNEALLENGEEIAYYIAPTNFAFNDAQSIRSIATHLCPRANHEEPYLHTRYRGILDKPFVVIANTDTVLQQSADDVNKIGGSHWISWVLLPKHYKNNGCERYQVFFFDSLAANSFPDALKHVLTAGLAQGEDVDGFALSPFCSADEIEFRDCHELTGQQKAQNDSNKTKGDCGWWAVYYALMTVYTGQVAFLAPLKNRSVSAGPLRLLMPLEQTFVNNMEVDDRAPRVILETFEGTFLDVDRQIAATPHATRALWEKAIASNELELAGLLMPTPVFHPLPEFLNTKRAGDDRIAQCLAQQAAAIKQWVKERQQIPARLEQKSWVDKFLGGPTTQSLEQKAYENFAKKIKNIQNAITKRLETEIDECYLALCKELKMNAPSLLNACLRAVHATVQNYSIDVDRPGTVEEITIEHNEKKKTYLKKVHKLQAAGYIFAQDIAQCILAERWSLHMQTKLKAEWLAKEDAMFPEWKAMNRTQRRAVFNHPLKEDSIDEEGHSLVLGALLEDNLGAYERFKHHHHLAYDLLDQIIQQRAWHWLPIIYGDESRFDKEELALWQRYGHNVTAFELASAKLQGSNKQLETIRERITLMQLLEGSFKMPAITNTQIAEAIDNLTVRLDGELKEAFNAEKTTHFRNSIIHQDRHPKEWERVLHKKRGILFKILEDSKKKVFFNFVGREWELVWLGKDCTNTLAEHEPANKLYIQKKANLQDRRAAYQAAKQQAFQANKDRMLPCFAYLTAEQQTHLTQLRLPIHIRNSEGLYLTECIVDPTTNTTLLHYLIEEGLWSIVYFLLEEGLGHTLKADAPKDHVKKTPFEIKDRQGYTVLHRLLIDKRWQTLYAIFTMVPFDAWDIEQGIKRKTTNILNMQDNEGNTLLHCLFFEMLQHWNDKNHPVHQIVLFLIKRGANLKIENQAGQFVYQLLQQVKQGRLREVLQQEIALTDQEVQGYTQVCTTLMHKGEISAIRHRGLYEILHLPLSLLQKRLIEYWCGNPAHSNRNGAQQIKQRQGEAVYQIVEPVKGSSSKKSKQFFEKKALIFLNQFQHAIGKAFLMHDDSSTLTALKDYLKEYPLSKRGRLAQEELQLVVRCETLLAAAQAEPEKYTFIPANKARTPIQAVPQNNASSEGNKKVIKIENLTKNDAAEKPSTKPETPSQQESNPEIPVKQPEEQDLKRESHGQLTPAQLIVERKKRENNENRVTPLVAEDNQESTSSLSSKMG